MTATKETEMAATWVEEIPGSALVHRGHVSDLPAPADVAAAIREFDDSAFLADLMGEALGKWFYEFKIQGKVVEGVSVVGAKEFARIRAEQGFPIRFPAGSIDVRDVVQNGEEGVRVTVVARDVRTGGEAIGMAFYPFLVERERNGEKVRVPDNMPDRKALSVAQRNAILGLVPQATILSMLRERAALVAANEQRQRVEAAEARKLLPQAPVTVVRGNSGGGSAGNAASGSSQTSGPVMKFGSSKGQPLADLPEKDLLSAVRWANEKGKFADAVTEMEDELDRRRDRDGQQQGGEAAAGELRLSDARRAPPVAQQEGR